MKNRVIIRNKVIFERKKEKAEDKGQKEESLTPRIARLFPRNLGLYSDTVKFDSLVRGCRRMLFRISAIFPFDLFPDEIIIDECKVSVVFREFFFSDDIHSINIEQIRDVDVETGPFFAKLQIVPDGYPSKPLIVRYLSKKQAYRARSIIQGLMVAKRNNIDLGKIDEPDLAGKLESLGRTHTIG